MFFCVLFVLVFSDNRPHLIEIGDGQRKWVSKSEMHSMKLSGENFFDVTDYPDMPSSALPLRRVHVYPSQLKMHHLVHVLQNEMDQRGMNEWLSTFCSVFHTRHAEYPEGLLASEYIEKQYLDFIQSLPSHRQDLISVKRIKTEGYEQFSVVVTMEGSKLKDEIVIIGAHLDSTATDKENAPGCDDDGSGMVAIWEVFKIISRSDFLPSRTLEFMSFAAEEVGLKGSAEIAYKYSQDDIDVYAMLNLDMTGYNEGVPWSLLVTDYTDHDLNEFTKLCLRDYSMVSFVEGEKGRACSDHASWHKNGYPSTFPAERILSEYYHTEFDTMDHLFMESVFEWTKFTLGFMIELAVE